MGQAAFDGQARGRIGCGEQRFELAFRGLGLTGGEVGGGEPELLCRGRQSTEAAGKEALGEAALAAKDKEHQPAQFARGRRTEAADLVLVPVVKLYQPVEIAGLTSGAERHV